MYGQMIPSKAWTDDNVEWIVLVTGDSPSDHLFSVYGTSAEEAERKAGYIVQAISTYEMAMIHMRDTKAPVPYNTSKPLDAQGIDLTDPRLHYGKTDAKVKWEVDITTTT